MLHPTTVRCSLGTAWCGPACQVVWGLGEKIPRLPDSLKVNVSEVTDVKVVSQLAKNLKSFQHAINHNFFEDSAKDLELCRKLLKVSMPYQEK